MLEDVVTPDIGINKYSKLEDILTPDIIELSIR